MRDYFLYPAQTNLELYAQAIERGYDETRLKQLSEAYRFALRQVYPLVRGSEKPFIAHLVGTASLVLESAAPADWVLGALLHALYQRRVPFEGCLAPDARRPVVAARFGTAVDDLLFRYTAMEDSDPAGWLVAGKVIEPDVLTLRLADELEDLVGYALAVHGSRDPGDASEKGGYLWRCQSKSTMAPAFYAAIQRLGLRGMERGLRHWLDFTSYPAAFAAARTGRLSSGLIELGSHGR